MTRAAQVQLGDSARFVTAQALAAQLGRTATVVGRQRLLKPLLTCDVLVLDELGYLPTEAAFGPGALRNRRRPPRPPPDDYHLQQEPDRVGGYRPGSDTIGMPPSSSA